MLRTEAARYARWSATLALLLAATTAMVYLNRDWHRYVEKKKAPPPAPIDVSRQSSALNFKKVEQNFTIFTVDASHSTEFKGQDASLLEDVKITIFGNSGERHDVIHTKSCRYGQKDGGVACSGDVQMDLLSAQDAERTAGNPAEQRARTVHVETRGVNFNRATGVAQSDQPVTFVFPSGTGSAVGLEYHSDEGRVRLLKDVRLTLSPPAASEAEQSNKNKNTATPTPRMASAVHITGTLLDFSRDTRLMHLLGPAVAETQSEKLTAGELSLSLDDQFRAETFVATAGPGAAGSRPTVSSKGTADAMTLNADTLTAHLSPNGSVVKVDASGSVHGTRDGPDGHDDAVADTGAIDLWPKVSQPKEVNLNGNVILRTQLIKTGDTRVLQTNALRMDFSGGNAGEPSVLQTAQTLATGTMEWNDSQQSGGTPARTRLQADKLAMDFGAKGKAKQLQATGHVQTERSLAGHPVQTATAQSGVAQMLATGGWSQMDLQGNVHLAEGDRKGQADHAVFQRASQLATLTGNAIARDATTETQASRIIFAQLTGDIRAEGGVRSTDFSAKGSTVQLAPVPANITADTLQANSKSGRALYTGHARLWQGDSVLEANSIELLRQERVLNAVGNVRGVFPQVAAPDSQRANAPSTETVAQRTPAPPPGSETSVKKAQLWHASSGALAYFDSEARAHLEHDVIVQSADHRMRGPVLDLYFTRATSPSAAISNFDKPNGSAQQISRAVGTGGVTVEEGTRKATAERGEYTATNGKFVMTGGNPTLYDGSDGTTTGRQLTFFLADDTIIVDSENRSRTLTKHRVEK
jgi:lipopolysaccharide export system protein LptA